MITIKFMLVKLKRKLTALARRKNEQCEYLTSWSWVLPETLICHQPVKKFPTFYETQKFFTAFTEPTISLYPKPDQFSPYSHPTSWRSILILNFHLCLGFQAVSFPHVSSPKHCMHLFCLPYVLHAPLMHSFWFDHPNNFWEGVQIMKILVMQSSPIHFSFATLKTHKCSSAPYSRTTSAYIPPSA